MKTLFKILFLTLITYLPLTLLAQVNENAPLYAETIHGAVSISVENRWNAHFRTDADKKFYFNRPILLNTGEIHPYQGNFKVITGANTRMTILESNGNTGIGVSNPVQRLHVRGVVRSSQRQKLSNYLEIGHGGTNSYINHSGVGRMDFRFGLKNKMSLKSDGKLVVGDADFLETPGDYKLYVEKGILAERVRVASKDNPVEWADYVFEKDYDLNSTEEVETFIKANKHLPNVPSAKEVGEKGVDIVQMDATLLRQIEELWLHVIELKKENETLKEKVEVLESTKR